MRYAYNTIGGTLEIDLHDNFARISNLDKPKLFTGSDADTIHQKILDWINSEMGGLNYRSLSNGTINKLDQTTIEKNLNRFKRFKSVQNALAQRLAGSYDVWTRQVEVDNQYCYTVNGKVFKYPRVNNGTGFSVNGTHIYFSIEEGLKWAATRFKAQGYFKLWRPREGQEPIQSGLAPEPVTEYRLVDAAGKLE